MNLRSRALTPAGLQRGVALPVALIFLLVLTVTGVSSLDTNVLEEKMAANSLNRELAFQAAEAALRAGERQVELTNDLHLRVFYNAGAPDSPLTGPPNDGDTCLGGFCTPVNQDVLVPYNPAARPGDSDFLYDRWSTLDTASDPNSLDVWNTSTRHIAYNNVSELDPSQKILDPANPPRFIIEFLGHWTPPAGSACDGPDPDLLPDPPNDVWPYCSNDPGMYRVTAMVETISGARVMLQSTYRK